MKLDVPDDYFPLLITALEHHYAYTKAVRREDTRYRQPADWFHRQPTPISDEPARTVKRPRVPRFTGPAKTTPSAPDWVTVASTKAEDGQRPYSITV
jgi:hypothetical protein